jgi:hypothetical protein
MQTTEGVLAYARELAGDLQRDMNWRASESGGGWWSAIDAETESVIAARAAAALELLRCYAGDDSQWTFRAQAMYDSNGGRRSMESGARGVGDLVRAWADQVESGIAEIVGARGRAEVNVASTDLMEQVRVLLADPKVHPAAAIVLCGAALETALRGAVDGRQLHLDGHANLTAYAQLLRAEGLLTAQDMKDLVQCAGLRNDAAHGHFDSLSRERAGLMEQLANLLLRRIADLLP